MIRGSRRMLAAVVLLSIAIFLWIGYPSRDRIPGLHGDSKEEYQGPPPGWRRAPFTHGFPKPPGSNYTRVLVLPKMKSESINWISRELPDTPTAVYEVDNPETSTQYKVPKNKGHEAMVYLTYIIDHYDQLPDTCIFIHSHKNAWHNNYLLDLDTAQTVRRLRDDRVARQGYMNLRCHLDPGCPNWIHIDRAEVDYDMGKKPEEQYFSFELFEEMFPGHRAPPVFSQPCCAQFAVSRERIRDNPKEMYEHLRNWLLETKLEDEHSGRVFEYMWQYLFTRNAEFCPDMNSCYCDGYGICFGSAKKLDDWLKKLREREIEEQKLPYNEQHEANQTKVQEMRDKIWRLVQELETEKKEAYRRGDEEKNRAIEREKQPKIS